MWAHEIWAQAVACCVLQILWAFQRWLEAFVQLRKQPKFPRRRKGGTTSEFSTIANPACEGCVV